ncbi:ICP0-binding domain of ubiquitin-specific protease 7-domain-containing protein [Fomitopsis serialis]|uniref:ICP0-binding domain of ubiquitin-specific protease 7-domain-containing protein n=1 Tax=Fomitopsis serialis TaxID=139415 RepID=UPI00200853A8|nr:ICP0-binding domain of ubiquitin-specific protease 7-domain-containing protein [Neoantrodia serialis]KAH9921290.1 ICP0-binding domain of ubiquitin-specific protease 7-domain-containing protein [Neoantrodia serialis]
MRVKANHGNTLSKHVRSWFSMRTISYSHQGSIMIFFKHFDTSKQTLYGAGNIHVQRASKVSNLVPMVHERMRWTPGTPAKVYEYYDFLQNRVMVLFRPKFEEPVHDHPEFNLILSKK